MPVAAGWRSKPAGTLGENGVTWICVTVASVTDSIVVPVTFMYVAEILVMPLARPVARPREPAALLTCATFMSEDSHVDMPVIATFVPSEKMAVATNCSGVLSVTVVLNGVTCTIV